MRDEHTLFMKASATNMNASEEMIYEGNPIWAPQHRPHGTFVHDTVHVNADVHIF